MRLLIFVVLCLGLLLLFGCSGVKSDVKVRNVASNLSEELPAGNQTIQNTSCTKLEGGGVNYSGTIYTKQCDNQERIKKYSCDESGKLTTEYERCASDEACVNGSCIKKTVETRPSEQKICVDSDSGINENVKGTIRYNGTIYEDYCVANSAVTEYYCDSDSLKQKLISCPNGYRCDSGACFTGELTCSDSNLQNQLSYGITTSFRGGVPIYRYTDSCKSSEEKTSYYCEGGLAKSKIEKCPSETFCESGGCKNRCGDSDDNNYFFAGNVSFMSNITNDYCKDKDTVIEMVCKEYGNSSVEFECGGPCYEGRCLQNKELVCIKKDNSAQLYFGAEKIMEEKPRCATYNTIREFDCNQGGIAQTIRRCGNNEYCKDAQCYNARSNSCMDLHSSNSERGAIITVGDDHEITGVYEDVCVDQNQLKVYQCVGRQTSNYIVTCPNGTTCNSGRCASS